MNQSIKCPDSITKEEFETDGNLFVIGSIHIRNCKRCKKGTEHKIEIYNEDKPESGDVYKCLECGGYYDYARIWDEYYR